MRQDIIWTNDGLIKWCIYVSLCLNELRETEVFVMHLCIIREMQADSHSVCICNGRPRWTGTTRTPGFWEYPPPPHDYPYYWVILDPKSKEDKVKVTNFKEFAKISNFWFWKQTLHATHLLLDKMCKYEMDLMSIVEDTERTWFCPQTDRQTDGRTVRQTRWNQYTPFQLRWSWGYNHVLTFFVCWITSHLILMFYQRS